MANSFIPPSSMRVFEYLAGVTEEQRAKIFSLMVSAPSGGDSLTLAFYLNSELKIPVEMTMSIVRFYIGVKLSLPDIDKDVAISSFRKTIESDLPKGNWNSFFESLSIIIGSEALIQAARLEFGESLQSQNERMFGAASIITTLVPFQIEDEEIGVVLSYQLKIDFLHGMQQDFFSIAMSERQLDHLRQTLVDSQNFGRMLTASVKNNKLKMLTIQENDTSN